MESEHKALILIVMLIAAVPLISFAIEAYVKLQSPCKVEAIK